MAVLLWVAFVLKLPLLVMIGAGIMGLSAILGVGRAPLVWLYMQTGDRLFPSGTEVVDEQGMRLAHIVATGMLLAVLGLFYYGPTGNRGWWTLLGIIAVFKTVGALGYCPVSRFFTCVLTRNGTCCAFLRPKSDA
jgi:hypothetical protein